MQIPRFRMSSKFKLPQELISILSSSHQISDRPLNRMRDVALKRVEDYLKAFPHQPHSVRDLCSVANVSQRTLRYAFMERFGIPPKSYLMALRLNGVRRDLRRADSARTTVTDLATRSGLLAHEPVCCRLPETSGELPSETMHRHN